MQERVEYQITDSEHPEENRTIPAIPDTAIVKTAEEVLREKLAQIRNMRAFIGRQTAEIENRRALKSRVAKRRRREKVAKASRKRNRG